MRETHTSCLEYPLQAVRETQLLTNGKGHVYTRLTTPPGTRPALSKESAHELALVPGPPPADPACFGLQ